MSVELYGNPIFSLKITDSYGTRYYDVSSFIPDPKEYISGKQTCETFYEEIYEDCEEKIIHILTKIRTEDGTIFVKF